MRPQLLFLKLVLDGASVESDPWTPKNRVISQKTIYLLQRAGVRSRYAYGWYANGPFSPELHEDLYELSGELTIEGTPRNKVLDTNTSQIIESVRRSFEPESNEVSKELWITALASAAYLLEEDKLDRATAAIRLEAIDPALRLLLPDAIRVLNRRGTEAA